MSRSGSTDHDDLRPQRSGRSASSLRVCASAVIVTGHTSGQLVKPKNTSSSRRAAGRVRTAGCLVVSASGGSGRGGASSVAVATRGLRAGLTLQQPARRQNAGGDGYNGDNSCERDRLSSGHRFLVARIIARRLMNPTPHPPGPAPVTLPAPDPATVEQLIHYGTLLFEQSQLWFGHGTDNAFDEAAELVFFGAELRHERRRGRVQPAARRRERARDPRADRAAHRRAHSRRLSHARTWFAGLPFYVDERVLVPRSPIAELIERAVRAVDRCRRVRRILDIGTGSGCIAIACAKAFPNARVDAVDISARRARGRGASTSPRTASDRRVRLVDSDHFAALARRALRYHREQSALCGRRARCAALPRGVSARAAAGARTPAAMASTRSRSF